MKFLFPEKFVFENRWYYPFFLSDLSYSRSYFLQKGKGIKTTNIMTKSYMQSVRQKKKVIILFYKRISTFKQILSDQLVEYRQRLGLKSRKDSKGLWELPRKFWRLPKQWRGEREAGCGWVFGKQVEICEREGNIERGSKGPECSPLWWVSIVLPFSEHDTYPNLFRKIKELICPATSQYYMIPLFEY